MLEDRTLIVIYNANGTLTGKVSYAYRKLRASPSSGPVCAACDITHGGLSLSETSDWTRTKSQIQQQGWQVVQWHREEVSEEVKSWIQTESLRYPIIISKDNGGYKVALTAEELATCSGEPGRLLQMLQDKQILSLAVPPSL